MHKLILLLLVALTLTGCNFAATSTIFAALREGASRVDINVTYTVEQLEPDGGMRPRKALVGVEYRVVPTALGVVPQDNIAVTGVCMGALADPGATSRPTLRELVLSSSSSSLTLREDVRITDIPAICAIPPAIPLVICTTGCSTATPVELYMRIIVDDCSAAFGATLQSACSDEIETTSWELAGSTSTDPAF